MHADLGHRVRSLCIQQYLVQIPSQQMDIYRINLHQFQCRIQTIGQYIQVIIPFKIRTQLKHR